MSGIFGVFQRDGSPVAPSIPEIMRGAMVDWGPDGSDMHLDGPIAMGRMHLVGTPEAGAGQVPPISTANGIIFTTAGRIDNREELMRESASGISKQGNAEIPDTEILRLAYGRWGENCSVRLHGDWALAAFDRKKRRLFLSRDHFGNTSLYYYADSRVFAFASSRGALLALDFAPREMDELYLAQILVSWFAYHGERTIHQSIKRLPPGHCITITPDRLELRRYWKLEETPELRLPKRDDYVQAFREVFDDAVKRRLRAAGDIAVTLSGGLDSGAVAATAARYMQGYDKRLFAFTSAPLSDPSAYVDKRFGDEFPLARATVHYAGNMDLYPVTATTITPLQAIRRILTISDEPSHGAGNLFWIQDLMENARERGCRVLLTGQMGNAGMSWGGDVFSQSINVQLRHFGWSRWAKEAAKRHLPLPLLKAYKRMRINKNSWWRSSAINPDFANRLDLLGRLLDAPDSPMSPKPRSPFKRRCHLIRPEGSFVGGIWAEVGAAFGLEVRDPTADARVLTFIFSVPDRIFIDPETGLDRWLIRETMKGRLPDKVRLNRRRGRQAGDRVPRLRASVEEVETALGELAAGPAAEYVNVPYMREVWRVILTDDTPEAFRKSATILTRGIMAGLWVNGLYNAS